MKTIEDAKQFAIAAHGDQQRKYTGEPYWHHLEEVAYLTSYSGDLDIPRHVVQAAWLHDVLEDTSVEFLELREEFGEWVADLVWWLTDQYISNTLYGNRKERKRLERLRFKGAPYYAKAIKLADLISNTNSIVERDPEFAKVYLEEKRLLLEEAMSDMKDHPLYKTALEAIN
jgi:(p)ppGpp synthase/HD superfamily hydrolase